MLEEKQLKSVVVGVRAGLTIGHTGQCPPGRRTFLGRGYHNLIYAPLMTYSYPSLTCNLLPPHITQTQ